MKAILDSYESEMTVNVGQVTNQRIKQLEEIIQTYQHQMSTLEQEVDLKNQTVVELQTRCNQVRCRKCRKMKGCRSKTFLLGSNLATSQTRQRITTPRIGHRVAICSWSSSCSLQVPRPSSQSPSRRKLISRSSLLSGVCARVLRSVKIHVAALGFLRRTCCAYLCAVRKLERKQLRNSWYRVLSVGCENEFPHVFRSLSGQSLPYVTDLLTVARALSGSSCQNCKHNTTKHWKAKRSWRLVSIRGICR